MALYSFAGLTVSMSPRFPTLLSRAEPYLMPDCHARPDFDISLPLEFFDAVRAEKPDLSDDVIEYMYSGAIFHRRLLSFDGMMLHSSAVAVDGKAFLFSAPPGTGKSTHTQAYLRLFGPRAVVINDDKPALRFFDGRLFACGTPFSGTSPLNANVSVPVGGICILRRGTSNSIKKISPKDALPELYSQTVTALSRSDGVLFLDVLSRVLDAAPLFLLHCTVGDDAAICSYEGMTGKSV